MNALPFAGGMSPVKLVSYIMPLVLTSAFLDSAASRPPVSSPSRSSIVLEHASSSGRSTKDRPMKISPSCFAKLIYQKER